MFPKPWLPRLIEIEYLKEHGTEEEQEYYSQFGFEKIVVPESYTHIVANFDALKTSFNQRYSARRVGWETLEMWQIHLQQLFDEEAGRLERAYALYDAYGTILDDNILEGMKTDHESTDESSGSDIVDGESESRNVDTPDVAINDNPDYADSRTSGTSKDITTYGRKNKVESSDTTEVYGRSVMDNINASIRDKIDLETTFVEKFENLFLNIFDYRGENMNERISLAEAYDNRSVIEQIKKIEFTSEEAEETAREAKTTANEAKTAANQASAKADEAWSLADNAQRTANEAKDIGTDARNVTIHLDHETWTFITQDERTITKEVVIYVN